MTSVQVPIVLISCLCAYKISEVEQLTTTVENLKLQRNSYNSCCQRPHTDFRYGLSRTYSTKGRSLLEAEKEFTNAQNPTAIEKARSECPTRVPY